MTINAKQYQKLIKYLLDYQLSPTVRNDPRYKFISFFVWGPSGFGKTQISDDACTAYGVPKIGFRPAEQPREDFGVPREEITTYGDKKVRHLEYAVGKFIPTYELDANGNRVKAKTHDGDRINFEKVKDYITNYEEMMELYNGDINEAPGCLFVVDEMTRIRDAEVVNMFFQFVERGQFRDSKLPAEIAILGIANPPTSNYQVSQWFDDEALAGRFVHFQFVPEFEDIINFYKKKGMSSKRLAFYQRNPEVLYDLEKIEQESDEFNIYERLAHAQGRKGDYLEACLGLMGIEHDEDDQLENEVVKGIHGVQYATLYRNFSEEYSEMPPTPTEIIEEYDAFPYGFVDDDNDVTYYAMLDRKGNMIPNENLDGVPIQDSVHEYLLTMEELSIADLMKIPAKSEARIKIQEKSQQAAMHGENNPSVDYIYKALDDLASHMIKLVEEDPENTKYLKKHMNKICCFLSDLPSSKRKMFLAKVSGDTGRNASKSELERKFMTLFSAEDVFDLVLRYDGEQSKATEESLV